MADLKGTKTEANLQAAFAGESQARNKYTYYASKARKDGYVQIANIFEETAANEKEHAKMWYKLLHGGIGSTAENLKAAAEGENFEWTDMYASFAKEAREEGFDDGEPDEPVVRALLSGQSGPAGEGKAEDPLLFQIYGRYDSDPSEQGVSAGMSGTDAGASGRGAEAGV